MTITNFRFRNENELVVLQVCSYKDSPYYGNDRTEWRDAKTEDLLDVANIIRNSPMTDRPSNPYPD